MITRANLVSAALAACLASLACDSTEDAPQGGSGGAAGGAMGAAGAGGAAAGTAQVPPEGAAAIDAWLATNQYQQWRCETAPHGARSPSPHGMNRICSNAAVSGHGTGPYPVGAASVKELFDRSGKLIGHAVALHAGSGNTGADWYWYEKVAGMGVVANGRGDSGVAKSVCVGCHVAAGTDAAHPGHDFLYTQVK